MNQSPQNEIQTILQTNQIQDLRRLIHDRKCLNRCNTTLIYLFHTVQTVGILTTTIAATYNNTEIVYVGIGLTFVASLISVYEKINQSLSNQWERDIQAIQSGAYIDGSFVQDDISVSGEKNV